MAQRSLVMRILGLIAIAVALAIPAQAQTPVSYAVTYLELKPGDAAAGRAVLRAYAESGRKEMGNLEFSIFQENGRPSRFAILEAWANRAALDRHFHVASRRLEALASFRAAPDDRRIYESLYAAPPANRSGELYVMTHVDVMPPYADSCAALLKIMRSQTPRDPGNVGYDVLRQEHEPNHFTIAQVWASRKDFDAYVGTAHTVAFRQKLLPMTGALYDERLFSEIR